MLYPVDCNAGMGTAARAEEGTSLVELSAQQLQQLLQQLHRLLQEPGGRISGRLDVPSTVGSLLERRVRS